MRKELGLTARGALLLALGTAAAAPGAEGERWFGGSAADFSKNSDFAGCPVAVKARFLRAEPEPGSSGRKAGFAVVAAGGEVRCEAPAGSREAELARLLSRGSPLVVRGTLDAPRGVVEVSGISQGWGRADLETCVSPLPGQAPKGGDK